MDRDDEEAGRLLDRVAEQVPVTAAPVGAVLVGARRARRRRRRLFAAVVALLLAGGAAQRASGGDRPTECVASSTHCEGFP